jgi:hypothetical protein
LLVGSYFITAEKLSTYTFSQFLTPFFYFFVRNPGKPPSGTLISTSVGYKGSVN